MAKRSKALFYWTWRGVGSNPAGDIYFHFDFFQSCSEQLSGSHANEIKHDHSPVVIVVLDQRYDLSYKALYIYSRSIAFIYIYVSLMNALE